MSLDLLKKPDTLRWFIYTPLAIVTLITLTPIVLSSPFNGFRIKDPLIPIDQIHHGGPPRDGIPSIDKPVFISARKADNLNPTDRVLGIELNNIKKAYPIKILNWHEIVNDRFDHQHLVISYCPLCGTGMAFKSDASSFGVSGLLYNSDMLLYDRKTKSLWSQIMAQAISGPLKGERLTPLAIEHTSWEDWSNRHPDTQVLSQKTGFNRSYSRSPYGHYETTRCHSFSSSTTKVDAITPRKRLLVYILMVFIKPILLLSLTNLVLRSSTTNWVLQVFELNSMPSIVLALSNTIQEKLCPA